MLKLNRHFLVILLLGFSAGLPLALTGYTLQAWLTVSGVDLVTIGLLGLVGQPYIFKFLWAPLLDRYQLPFLGRRRGWLVVTQLLLLAGITAVAFVDPKSHPWLVAALALFIAIFSATQDIVVDAYRTDVLPQQERGLGVAAYMGGYRIAMLVSGGLALVLADHLGWQMTYLLMAGLISLGIVATWLGEEPSAVAAPPQKLITAVVQPFKEFSSRGNVAAILLFIVLYKLGDAFIMSLSNAFLLRGLQFSLTEVGAISKIGGLTAGFVGLIIGASLLNRLGMFPALLIFGVMQSLSNFLYVLLAFAGKNYALMVVTVLTESAVASMCGVALVAFLMALCDHRYSATQYALFSALAALGRVLVAPVAGWLAEKFGWPSFFICGFLVTMPALLLLGYLRERITSEKNRAIAALAV